MKTELKAKYIQHLINKKKSEEGFTLIELLVVIIIIGILSAIALPSFLNQANKAKQSEAKTYVGSMNRGQQSFYVENTKFTSGLNDLGIGITSQTENYQYSNIVGTAPTGTTAIVTTIGNAYVADTPLRSYHGNVWATAATADQESTTLAILCEKRTSGGGLSAANDATDCNADYKGI